MSDAPSRSEPAPRWWDADLRALGARQRYKLLAGLVVPRPIALVSTLSADGVRNAAPYSFFNVFSDDPPIVAIGVGGEGTAAAPYKDTLRNVIDTGEFVVNLVDEPLMGAMNVTAIAFPSGTDEFVEADLTPAPSVQVRAPRIAQAPVQLECRLSSLVPLGDRGRRLLLGEVVHVHVREGVVDADTLDVDGAALALVGRLYGGGWYTRTADRFEKPRWTLAAWKARGG
jgi:flavin reductase (DIM6/NTAB) family NADH-FMN oxidoreductase RutF